MVTIKSSIGLNWQIDTLKRENYATWSKRVERFFRAERLWAIVSGEMKSPARIFKPGSDELDEATETAIEAFEKDQKRALEILRLLVSEPVLKPVSSVTNPAILWTLLQMSDTGPSLRRVNRKKEMREISTMGYNLGEIPAVFAHNVSDLWHRRLCHLDSASIQLLPNLVGEMPRISGIYNCSDCCRERLDERPDPQSPTTPKRSTLLLEVVNFAIAGPMDINSLDGYKYYMILSDDFSGYSTTYILRQKAECIIYHEMYKRIVEKLHSKSIQNYRSESGDNYTPAEFDKYLVEVSQSNSRHPPKSQINRSLVGLSVVLMLGGGTPSSYWAEAMRTAVHIRNITPDRIPPREFPIIDQTPLFNLKGKPERPQTPYEKWGEGVKPTVGHLRIFGCRAYFPAIQRNNSGRQHLVGNPIKVVFVGYRLSDGEYRLWDPVARRVIITSNVSFREDLPGIRPTPKLDYGRELGLPPAVSVASRSSAGAYFVPIASGAMKRIAGPSPLSQVSIFGSDEPKATGSSAESLTENAIPKL